MRYYKKYIDVVVHIDHVGNSLPLFIVYQNRKFKIDKKLHTEKTFSRVEGGGILYRCLIQDQERNVFFERHRWFIESVKP